MSPRTLKGTIIGLFVLTFLSLGLNGYLIQQWFETRRQARAVATELQPILSDTLNQAATDLAAFEQSTLTFEIQVEQALPIEAEVPLDEAIEVPIQMTIPISQAIETSILMDPFESGLMIPVDIVVPVNMEVPIDTVVPVRLNRTLTISTSVDLNLDVPIEVEVSKTELAPYLKKLQTNIVALNESLNEVINNAAE